MPQRGELVERSFAHNLETGGKRRTHLRYHDNILKMMLVQVAAFNLSLAWRFFGPVKPEKMPSGRRRSDAKEPIRVEVVRMDYIVEQ